MNISIPDGNTPIRSTPNRILELLYMDREAAVLTLKEDVLTEPF